MNNGNEQTMMMNKNTLWNIIKEMEAAREVNRIKLLSEQAAPRARLALMKTPFIVVVLVASVLTLILLTS